MSFFSLVMMQFIFDLCRLRIIYDEQCSCIWMKKEIKTRLKFIGDKVYGKAVERFDDKLLLFTTLSVTAILVVSSVFNVMVELKPAIIISSIVGTLIFFTLYLFGRFVARSSFIDYHSELFLYSTLISSGFWIMARTDQ